MSINNIRQASLRAVRPGQDSSVQSFPAASSKTALKDSFVVEKGEPSSACHRDLHPPLQGSASGALMGAAALLGKIRSASGYSASTLLGTTRTFANLIGLSSIADPSVAGAELFRSKILPGAGCSRVADTRTRHESVLTFISNKKDVVAALGFVIDEEHGILHYPSPESLAARIRSLHEQWGTRVSLLPKRVSNIVNDDEYERMIVDGYFPYADGVADPFIHYHDVGDHFFPFIFAPEAFVPAIERLAFLRSFREALLRCIPSLDGVNANAVREFLGTPYYWGFTSLMQRESLAVESNSQQIESCFESGGRMNSLETFIGRLGDTSAADLRAKILTEEKVPQAVKDVLVTLEASNIKLDSFECAELVRQRLGCSLDP